MGNSTRYKNKYPQIRSRFLKMWAEKVKNSSNSLILAMKKLFVIGCMILGSCVIAGCGNGTATNGNEKDSVIVDSIDSIEVVDSIDSIAVDSICND